MHARLCGSKSVLTLYQIINKTWADEIAEPRPDMNAKVAAFTVSEKPINKSMYLNCLFKYMSSYICIGMSLDWLDYLY